MGKIGCFFVLFILICAEWDCFWLIPVIIFLIILVSGLSGVKQPPSNATAVAGILRRLEEEEAQKSGNTTAGMCEDIDSYEVATTENLEATKAAFPAISGDYYRNLKRLVDHLGKFYLQQKRNPAFMKVVAECEALDMSLDGNDKPCPEKKWEALALFDFVKWFVMTKHPLRLQEREGIALLLLYSYTQKNGTMNLEYEYLYLVNSGNTIEVLEDFFNQYRQGVEANNLPDEVSTLKDILSLYDPTLVATYFRRLYRVMNAIACADGEVTADEKKCLSILLNYAYLDPIPLNVNERFKEAARIVVQNQCAEARLLEENMDGLKPQESFELLTEMEMAQIVSRVHKKSGRKVWVTNEEELEMLFSRITPIRDVQAQNKGEKEGEKNPLEEFAPQQQKDENEKDPLEELQSLIGLDSVKRDITNLQNFILIQKEREKIGLPNSKIVYHCAFTGNPGTGKTTVARILARIYRDLGVLKKGHLVEADRSSLIAEYQGQTAVKTNRVIDRALDGVLFIDEAYSLANGENDSYGQEAIATLLKRMEDERHRLVVFIAGYGNEMQHFIDSNPGLQSRFNRYISFPDYSSDELYRIFLFNLDKYKYVLSPEAEKNVKAYFDQAVAEKDDNFGNARLVRNYFEKTIQQQANRLAENKMDLTQKALTTIEANDVLISE